MIAVTLHHTAPHSRLTTPSDTMNCFQVILLCFVTQPSLSRTICVPVAIHWSLVGSISGSLIENNVSFSPRICQ